MGTVIQEERLGSFQSGACYYCVVSRLDRLLDYYRASEQDRDRCHHRLCELYEASGEGLAYPELLREGYRLLDEEFDFRGDLWEVKRRMNERALELYSMLKLYIRKSSNPFAQAARIVLAALNIDFYGLESSEIHALIRERLREPLHVDHLLALEEACRRGRRVLYLGAGEGSIVFDRLFIQQMRSREVVYVVNRSRYAGLSVCGQDADYADIRQCARVLENGCDAPITILSHASDRFMEAYGSADTIVAVGQTHLESLYGYGDPRLYALVQSRCECTVDALDLPVGSWGVLNVEDQLKTLGRTGG